MAKVWVNLTYFGCEKLTWYLCSMCDARKKEKTWPSAMFFLSFILFSCWVLVTHLGGKSSGNLTNFGCETLNWYLCSMCVARKKEKTWPSAMFFLSFILFCCLTLVTHLGGKSSANLTYFGREKTLLWHLPSTIGYVSDQSTSDGFRWQKFGLLDLLWLWKNVTLTPIFYYRLC